MHRRDELVATLKREATEAIRSRPAPDAVHTISDVDRDRTMGRSCNLTAVSRESTAGTALSTELGRLAAHASSRRAPRLCRRQRAGRHRRVHAPRRSAGTCSSCVEHDDLRRAHDRRHFVLARQLARTLVTLDRDYLDDRRYPPAETGGLIVLYAPTEPLLTRTLQQIDDQLFARRPRSRCRCAGKSWWPIPSGWKPCTHDHDLVRRPRRAAGLDPRPRHARARDGRISDVRPGRMIARATTGTT